MITWIRPSGTEITTSDTEANKEMASKLGWKRKPKSRAAKKCTQQNKS